jgi:hypothetical protein
MAPSRGAAMIESDTRGLLPHCASVLTVRAMATQVLIGAEVAMGATDGLRRRPGEGVRRSDDAGTVWGDDTNRPACAPGQPHSPPDTADRPAALAATIPSRGGKGAPAEQHSRQRIQWGPVTRGAEAARPLVRTCLRSVLTLAQRVPAGVLVVPLALLLFLLMLADDSITALTVVPLWVVLPPLVLLLLLLVFAQRGRLTVRTAVPVWTLLVPVTLLLLLLGLARASTPPSPAQQAATTVITAPPQFGQTQPLQPSPVAPSIQLQPSPVARPQVVERVRYSGNGLGSAKDGATANTSHVPAPTATAPGTIVIHNSPRTAVVGQTEHFSVLLPGQPHTALTYMLHYPDGHEEHIPVRTDGHGYSSYTFHVSLYQARRFRDMGTVGVADADGRVLAYTHIAIQQH